MRALDDLGGAIVAPDAFDQLVVRLARALGDEDVARASQIPRRLAQRSARQQILVSKRRLPIDQHDVEPVFQVQILQAVIEQERVGLEFLDREQAALYPVLVDEHDHVFQIVREHVGLVARGQRIEQERLAVGDDARRRGIFPAEALPPFARNGTRHALVAATENRDPPAAGPQGPRELFDDRRLAGAADGEIANADDETPEGALAENAVAIKKKAKLHEPFVNEGEPVKQRPEQRRPHAMTPFQNDVDRELLEIFSAVTHRSEIVGLRIANCDCASRRAPRLSAAVMIVRAPSEFAAASMAREILSGERRVTAQMVEPEPLKKAPSAPADSAAAMTSSRKGISFLRKGWCR